MPLAQIRFIRAYVEQFHPGAARALADDHIAAGNGLVNLPLRARKVPGTGMTELVTAHPCIIRYRVAGTVVRFPRVRHTAQRPANP
jgi:plasmid stabilization system protein ParE